MPHHKNTTSLWRITGIRKAYNNRVSKRKYRENFNNYRDRAKYRNMISSSRNKMIKSLPVDDLLHKVGFFD